MGQEIIVLFHSVLGLRPAVREFAERLHAAGHTVHTPDLFEGRVFDRIDVGSRHRDEVGMALIGAEPRSRAVPLADGELLLQCEVLKEEGPPRSEPRLRQPSSSAT